MKKILITSTLFLLIVSCSKKSDNTTIIENAAENTTSSFPIKRMGNSEAIVDGIFNEQIKKDEKLKKFHEKFLALQNDTRVVNNIYNDIISNSESYYNDAQIRAKNIHDSLLKKQLLALVLNSSEKYDLKVRNIEKLKIQTNINYSKLNSLYNAFKIKKTLPEIEKYQNAHPLKTDSLNNFINKQNQLLNELKNLK